MTREEREKAIYALKISAPLMAVTQGEFNDYIQTLNKIMDWLEQEPCEDAVSRQAAIDELYKMLHDCFGADDEELDAVITTLNELPPVTPQYTDAEIQKMQDLEFAEIQKAYEIGKAENPNKWIPVSERLPDIRNYCQLYLVTYKHGQICTAFFTETNGRCWWSIDGVTAWMPLPEPYKASPTGTESEVSDADSD